MENTTVSIGDSGTYTVSTEDVGTYILDNFELVHLLDCPHNHTERRLTLKLKRS